MKHCNFTCRRVAATNRLRSSCLRLGSNRFELIREMRRLAPLLLVVFFLGAAPQVSRAQEAVSSTGTSGASASTSAASSTSTTTGELSTGTATTTPGAVTNSSLSGTALEGGPSGVGVFSPTPVKIYATISGGYDDNVNTLQNNKQGSAFTSGNVILDYTFGDPRLQIILNGGAGGTYYYEQVSGQNYDIDLKGALAITYKSSPRLTLGSTLLVEYLTEPSFDAPGGLNSRNGNYLYTTDKLFVSYAWSQRFSTKTSYTFEAYNYDNNAVAIFSNRISNTFANEFHFQLVPTTSLVAEYRYGLVTYEDA